MKIMFALIVFSNISGGVTTVRLGTYETYSSCQTQASKLKETGPINYLNTYCLPVNGL